MKPERQQRRDLFFTLVSFFVTVAAGLVVWVATFLGFGRFFLAVLLMALASLTALVAAVLLRHDVSAVAYLVAAGAWVVAVSHRPLSLTIGLVAFVTLAAWASSIGTQSSVDGRR